LLLSNRSFIRRALRWLVYLSAILCALWFLLLWLFEWYRDGVCYREVLADIPISGFNFEVFAEDCWHNPEVGVFVYKRGQSSKKLLFLYDTIEAPAIVPLDNHTIQISLGDIGVIFCRNDKWQDFTIKYDIRSVQYPQSNVRECR
jgi:hypothetical protein